jgi:fatty acid desaturase
MQDATFMAPYEQLREQMASAGLFKKRPLFYALYAFILICALMASLGFITFTDNIFLQTINALVLAGIFMQFGFFGHDIAHHQVFSSVKKDIWFGGTLYALGLGISLDHWYGSHNEHHKNTNKVGSDPDIDLPLVFSQDELATRGVKYRRYILPYQHIYFFAFMPLAYLNYVLVSLPWPITKLKRPIRIYEFTLSIVHFAILFAVVFYSLGLWLGIYFIFITMIAGGAYAGFSFAPNHKGEETLSPEEKVTWRTQITSTRNIYGGKFIDLALGGLNYQVEHHLFSYMPRPNLARAQRIIEAFCRNEKIPYHQTTFTGSVMEMYRTLRYFALQK